MINLLKNETPNLVQTPQNLTIRWGKFSAEIFFRTQKNGYPSYDWAARLQTDTPKGKFTKVKVFKTYVYKSFREAKEAAQNWIDTQRYYYERRENEKAEKRAKNKDVKASDFYKVGDTVVNTWGWEQTNVSFYKVVEMTEKTILIKQVRARQEENSMHSHGMACNLIPGDNFVENGDEYRLKVSAGGRLSNPERYYHMHKWDGRPQYCSWYA